MPTLSLSDRLARGIPDARPNVIAVQAHNSSLSASSDFFFDLRLTAQTGPASRVRPPARGTRFTRRTAPPAVRQASHSPEQPVSGQPVKIRSKVSDPDGVASVTLLYQAVDPGNYIE